MKRCSRLLSTFSLLLLLAAAVQAQQPTISTQRLVQHEPRSFVANNGQWDPGARFLSRMHGLDIWVTDHDVTYDLYRRDRDGRSLQGHVVRMKFVGGSARSLATASTPSAAPHHYLSTANGSTVASSSYGEVRLNDLYPGIDASLYFDGGLPRYDLLVAPGADPSSISLRWEGAHNVRTSSQGDLLLTTSVGELRQEKLFAYQMIDGVRRQIPCAFDLKEDGTVGFTLGRYDVTRPLVIDPIVYSTYLGGDDDDRINAMARDRAGNLYVTGATYSANFPTTPGAYNRILGPSGFDVFVSKLDPSGSILIYSTLVGSGEAFGIDVDATGHAYITGTTANDTYPTTPGSYAGIVARSSNVFVTKLSADGSGLDYSTIIGAGDGADIKVRNGQAYITGTTSTATFPYTRGAYDTVQGGGIAAFLTRLNASGSGLVNSTFINGMISVDLALNNAGQAYVAGYSSDPSFPVTIGSYQGISGGKSDIAIACISANGDSLLRSTLLGGNSFDEAMAIALDTAGDVYVTGNTQSRDFPTTVGAFRRNTIDSNDVFVAKFSRRLDSLRYSTFIGGKDVERGMDIAVDIRGAAYVAGQTSSIDYPVTTSRYQGTLKGPQDAFLTKLSPAGNSLAYSSYLGGASSETGMAIVVDSVRDVYIAGYSGSTDYPGTSDGYQTANGGGEDGFITKFAILEILKPNGGEVLCAPSIDTIRWNGDPSASYNISISHDNGATYTLLASNVPGNTFLWPIGESFPPDTNYRIRITTLDGTESYQSASRFTINAAPQIQAQPSNLTASAGSNVTFTSIVRGTPTPMVQWQVDTGTGFRNIPGATSSPLRLNNVAGRQNGYRYRAIFSNGCGSDTTDAATLRVTAVSLLNPNGGEQYCAGDTATISWNSIGTSGPYRLELSSNGGANWVTIAQNIPGTSYTWVIPGNLSGFGYRVRVTLPPGFTQDVSDADFTINSQAAVSEEPVDFTVPRGGAIVFKANATGFPFADVIWQVDSGNGWNTISGSTSRSLTVFDARVAQTGHRYRAIFSTVCGSDTTRGALLTVEELTFGVDDGATGSGGIAMNIAPNPARGSAEITIDLDHGGMAELTVYGIDGREVAHPLSGRLSAGENRVRVDLSSLPSGIYTCVLDLDGARRVVKLTVAR